MACVRCVCAESKILLGSIRRQELQTLLDEHLSPAKRHAYFQDMAVRFSATGAPPDVMVTPPTPQAQHDTDTPLVSEWRVHSGVVTAACSRQRVHNGVVTVACSQQRVHSTGIS